MWGVRVFAPIILRQENIGLVEVGYHRSEISNVEDSKLRLLRAFIDQTALAVASARSYDAAKQELAERKRAEKQLLYNAFHDALTGLPNRTLFMDHLKRSIGHAKRHGDYRFAVLFLDLDRFKVINDSLGHLVGDQLLVSVAKELESCVRPGDTVARLGGDEFAILLDDIHDLRDAERIANQIQYRVASPVNLKGQEVSTSVSIGITLGDRSLNQPEDFLRDSDTAMYRAKDQGGGRYAMFDAEMHVQILTRLRLETDLRRAFENRDLEVYYQPILSLKSGRITSAEALLRWKHPDHGFIPPSQFIPVAEETGLIIPIGKWLLHTVCAQAKRWHNAGYTDLSLAVNVSVRQFQHQNLPELVEDVLRETGLSTDSLELEVTESIAMISEDVSLATLNELNQIGVKISIDDFGTGYSSLSRLRSLPVNTLKIDQSFVQDITDDNADQTLITAMIAMAHTLNLKVIAEGVETEEQLTFLRSQQCDEMQGYLFSRSLPAPAMTDLLQSGRHL
ncbi:MAG: EAL domain-containing protein [Chloroflexota bacterium]